MYRTAERMKVRRDAAKRLDDRRNDDRIFILERVPVVAAKRLDRPAPGLVVKRGLSRPR